MLLCVFSVVIALLNTFYSIYQVYRDQVIQNTIQSNRVYAKKLAEMTESYIDESMKQLKYSSSLLSQNINNTTIINSEVERLRSQTNSFNAIIIVSIDGFILAKSPTNFNIKSDDLSQDYLLEISKKSHPFIIQPFTSPSGKYLLVIASPIISKDGKNLGHIAGIIYLKEKNALTMLLGEHDYEDGSYIYVVNQESTLIYHPGQDRVGEIITNNTAISAVLNGEQGGDVIVNSQGIEMLAGYAPINNSGWGIIVQRPKLLAMTILDEHIRTVFLKSLPISLLTFLLIWVFSFLISRPLWQLANTVKRFDDHSSIINELEEVKPWYFEASNLKLSLLKAFGNVSNTIEKLHEDCLTDPMTGLLNRRGLEKAIEQLSDLVEHGLPFSILVLDIDHFKRINDTFGHDIGDIVLVDIACFINAQAREQDILCRYGGEEFLMFLINTDINHAFEVAERIRKSVESHTFKNIGNISLSIGVSSWNYSKNTIEDSIKDADQALYQAKNKGRNRTEISKI